MKILTNQLILIAALDLGILTKLTGSGPVQVSDATSPGIGVYAGHFHDSNREGRDGLKAALNEMITFNFLGVTTVGPNICTDGVFISINLCFLVVDNLPQNKKV